MIALRFNKKAGGSRFWSTAVWCEQRRLDGRKHHNKTWRLQEAGLQVRMHSVSEITLMLVGAYWRSCSCVAFLCLPLFCFWALGPRRQYINAILSGYGAWPLACNICIQVPTYLYASLRQPDFGNAWLL